MIIVKLKGGLGNQLFQYAIGRYLAEVHGTEVKMDISFFDTYKLHTFSIWPLNIRENIAIQEEVMALTVKMPRVYREKQFHFDADVLKLPDFVYLDGYWQSEKYFSDIADIIRKEFTVKFPQIGRDKDVAEQISLCNSVCLHIRRGSYLLPEHSIHGICPMEYYSRCLDYLDRKEKDLHLFIFSDDPDWVSENSHFNYPVTIVRHNGPEKDYEDLRLMAQCKHFIIANSTFSWWGAWLSSNENKIVFAPRRWFASGDLDTRDLLPDGWIRY